MSVAKLELSATSPTRFEDAIQSAILKASETVHDIRSAWVKEQRSASRTARSSSTAWTSR